MSKVCRHSVEVKVFYVESKTKKTKKGKPETMRIVHRKLLLVDPNAMFDSGDYRIVAKTSKMKPTKYTISVITRKAQSIWTNPTGKPDVWHKLDPDTFEQDENGVVTRVRPFKRTDDAPMNDAGILRWLTTRMGLQQALRALDTLLTQAPDNEQMKLAA